MNDLGLIALVEAVKELGYPTEGPTAHALWQWLSSNYGPPANVGAAIYRRLGYEPFKGYPLVRKT